MEDKIIKSSFWNSIFLISGKVLFILFAFVSISLTTRILGPAGYGKLSLFLAVIQAFIILGFSWNDSSVIRYGVEEFTKTGRMNKTFWNRSLFIFPMVILSLGIFWFTKSRIISYTKISNLDFKLIVFFFLFFLLSKEVQLYLKSINKLKLYSFLPTIERSLVILGLMFVVLGLVKEEVLNVILIFLVANVILFTPIFMFLFFKYMLPFHVDKELLKRFILFSLPLIFYMINAYLFNWIDIIIINRYMQVGDVGIYSLAYNGMSIFQQFSMMTTVITIPLLVTFFTKKRVDLIKIYVTRIVPQALFFWMVLLSLCIMAARVIIPVLGGQRFSQAVIPFSGLLIGLMASGFSSLYTPVFHAYEMIKHIAFITFVSTPINILGDFILIPKIGIMGAVIATSLSFFIAAFLRSLVIHRKLGLKIDYKLFIFLIPIFIVLYCFNIKPCAINFIWGTVAFVISLSVIALKSHLFSREDVRILKHIDMPIFFKKGMEKFYITMDALSYRNY